MTTEITVILLIIPTLVTGSTISSLPGDTIACRPVDISFIPDNIRYHEESIQLSFDSGMSLNNVLVTRILEEECGFRDKKMSTSYGRYKRSTSRRGKFSFQNYFMEFYQKSSKVLNSKLLKGIKNVVEHLNHIKPSMKHVKSAKTGKFFYQVWRNLEEVRMESSDEHFDLMLEQTIRTSIQLLIENGELSEVLLYHPNVLNHIKRRIPIINGKLLSEVKVSHVKCHPTNRDSQVVLLMKLKIPMVETKTIDQCDDIGRISHNSYQYYELPTATFSRNGNIYQVDFEKCTHENFIFCPSEAILSTDCSKEDVTGCSIKEIENPEEIVRELQHGFAVYGDFTQVITKKNDRISHFFVNPHLLYHIIPQSSETILLDGKELAQMTHSKITIITEV